MKITRMIRKTPIGKLLHLNYWQIRGQYELKKYDDYQFINMFYSKLGRNLDLKNPQRYTEKLQWLKLFYRDEIIRICSDKYEVRSYIEKKGYGHLLNECIALYNSPSEINFDQLPNSFVIKATHGSGWNLIVKDKTKVNWFVWKQIMKMWLKQNPYWFGREWNYKDLKPRLVVEKYLEDDSGELRDYKFFCFNGEPQYVEVDANRLTNHKRVYLDITGVPINMHDSHSHGDDFVFPFGEIQKQMIDIARDLAKPFPNVRVDFYEYEGRIIFGELTFFDGSGFYSFDPDEWDYIWGKAINLPKPNYNLDLYEIIRKG